MAILQGARITGSIIATSFIKATGFSGSLTASNLYVLGKAGIGTSSPLYKTDIAGSTGYDITTDNATVLRVRSITSRYPTFPGETTAIALTKTNEPYGWRLLSQYVADTYAGANFHIQNSINVTPAWESKLTILRDGNVGIGTTSPLTKLNLSGGSGAVYQTFTDTTNAYHHGYIGKNGGGLVFGFSSQNGSFSADEKMRIDTTGNVGIGTTTVGNKLTVTTSTQYDGYYLRNVNGVVGTMLGVSATNDDGTVGLYSSTVLKTNITANGVSYFNGGSVGIGTSTPSYKLHISGAAQTILGIDSATTTNVAQFQAKANGDGVLISGIFGTTSVGNNYGVAAASQAYVGTTTLNTGYPSSLVIGNVSSIPIAFSTNNTERMRIDGSGNVGIGTSSPSYKLDVAGGIKIGGEETLPFAIGSMYLSYNSAINRIYYGDGTGYDLRFSKRGAGATTDFVTFKDTGNVGIGTTSPAYKLDVNGVGRFIGNIALITDASSNDYSLIGHYYSGSIKAFSGYSGGSAIYGGEAGIPTSFQAGGQSAIRILTNGNVGIGTTSPGYTLEVNGTQRVVGNFYLFNTVVNPASNFANQRGVGFEASTGKLEVAASGSNALSIGRFGSTGQILDFRYAGTQIGNFSLDTNDLTLATARHLILSPTGNVGIGTSSPAAKLQVNVNSVTGVRINGTGGFANIISQGGHLEFYKDSTPTYAAAIGLSTPATALSNDIQFATYNGSSWSARMTIQNGGNVGIGTTSPVNKLHVSGSSTNLPLKLEGLTSNATGYFLTVDNTTGVVYKSTSGASGTSGTSGANGSPGTSGTSGTSGANGSPGTSGTSGTSGANGSPGTSGSSGTSSIKAWVHFDGGGTSGTSGISPNASNNVSSITDNGTGDYTVNFTTAFANANYVVAGTATFEYENPGQSINNMFIAVPRRPSAQTTTSCRIVTPGYDNVLYDCKYVRVLFSN